MINMKPVLSIARAETRVTRRLVRYWVFLAVSYAIVFIAYIYYSVLHGLFSSYSASVGLICPKYLVSAMGAYYLMIYTVGVVFLAFDVRARDQRERMAEVLDSRPYSNLELVFGRYLGVLVSTWVPILICAVLLELLGLLLKGVGSPIGEPVEVFSLLNFAFLMSIPALAFVISMVFLVTLLVRNRLVAAVILLVFLGLSYWAMLQLPIYQARIFDIFGVFRLKFPSDIVFLLDPYAILQRVAILLASIGILGISAAVHPRLDDGSRSKLAFGGIAGVVIAAAVIGIIYNKDVRDLEKPEMWLKAQSAYSQAPVPDMEKISGYVNIDPGKSLGLDLDITFRAPDSGPIKNAIFTLNPGQRVTKVLDASGSPLSYNHKNGILDITLPDTLEPGKEADIKLNIKGIPDKNFSYLKSSYYHLKSKALEANIGLLGTESDIYNSSFVALMPAVRWLPVSGPENNRNNPRIRPVDYFNVDLYVRLPKGWLVAGPGRRYKVEEKKDSNVFRFSPPSVVPEVALIASKFESRSFKVDNVVMELLISKKHLKNVEVLADTGDKIREWVGERLKEAKENGLAYPYGGFTLVEVPTDLRTYGGGWRLDTVQALPGIFLLKELSLPTARFDSAFRNPEKFKDKEGGITEAKWERLQEFFKNDFSGGNVLTGASRNFFMYQTSAVGPESPALNFVMETLSSLLVTDTKGYFSAHVFTAGTRMNSLISKVIINYQLLRGIGETVSNAAIRTMTSRPEIWEKAQEVSLKDMNPWQDPADAIDVLTLKGYAIADSIFNMLGREKTYKLLSTIRNNHTGQSFTFKDVINAGKALGYNLNELLGDWIDSPRLPGFVVPEAKGYRISDDENGNPRYQLLFTVRNDEPVPGIFRFTYYYAGKNRKSELTQSNPIRLEGRHAIQYGTIVSRLPNMYFLSPYLSLNRGTFKIKMNTIDQENIVKKDPIHGIKEIPWEIPASSSLTVDDLDNGFKTTAVEEKKKGLRIKSGRNRNEETDHGLPYISFNILPKGLPLPGEWSRMSSTNAWGKYRHTAVIIKSGNGSKKAMFSTSLPKDGSWDLEFYLPGKGVFSGRKWGIFNIVVKDSNGDRHEVKFDSNAGIEGWNLVDKLNLPEGKVTVELSDKTDGDLVVADAIRWTPSAGN